MSRSTAPESADIVVLNTCHIREKAAEKLYSDIGRLRKPRADGSRPVIVAAGCVAQAEGAEIGRRAPAVDVIVGPLAYHRLPELAEAKPPRSPRMRAARAGAAPSIPTCRWSKSSVNCRRAATRAPARS